jgi:GAF domain-containing protein/anti-sigma regulatory factor (Ser/Thr protein kinase)
LLDGGRFLRGARRCVHDTNAIRFRRRPAVASVPGEHAPSIGPGPPSVPFAALSNPGNQPQQFSGNLQRVTEAALAYLDLDRLMALLLERIVEILDVDTSAILLLDEQTNELAARAARGLEEEVERGFRVPVGKGFAGRVAAEMRPVAIANLAPGDAVNPLLYEKRIRSLLGVPLIVEGRLIGVLHVGTLTPRVFDDDDTTILQVVADRVALAIDHARLFEAERGARTDAEQTLERLQQLQGVTDSTLAYLDLDNLLAVLLDRTAQMLGADTAVILLASEDGQMLTARAAKGLEEEVERGFTLPIGRGFAGRVANERRPVVLPEVTPEVVVNPLMFEKGVRSLLGVPMIVERRLIGVLHVGTLTPREFGESDIQLLQAVADRAALAIEHDRLFEQHRVAQMLQRSLLPTELPQPPGLSFAARYLPAAAKRLVGGDWYDVIEMPDGGVGVAIGDVVGHGVEAATLMGALRNALQAYALQGLSPAEIAPLLSRFAAAGDRSQMATYLYGVVDPARTCFRFVNGSHPSPVLVQPDGSAAVVESTLLPPLGAPVMARVEDTRVRLEPGTTLVLYTDGLVERRGERLATRQEELREAAAAASIEPELLVESLINRMLGGESPADDVAILTMQRAATANEALNLTVAARPEELAAVRRLLRGWLADGGADHRAIDAVLLASGEACTNAIEHAYGPGERTFELEGERDGNDVVLVIRDQGRWRPPRGQNRGRGLGLMETFMDEVEVTPSDSGTAVRMRRKITA